MAIPAFLAWFFESKSAADEKDGEWHAMTAAAYERATGQSAPAMSSCFRRWTGWQWAYKVEPESEDDFLARQY